MMDLPNQGKTPPTPFYFIDQRRQALNVHHVLTILHKPTTPILHKNLQCYHKLLKTHSLNMENTDFSFSYTKLSYFVLFAISVAVLVKTWSAKKGKKLNVPPGPPGIPVLGNLLDLGKRPFTDMVKELQKTYGGIFMLRMGTRSIVIVTSAELAHEALVEKAQLFASRPAETPTRTIFSSDKCTINSALYGARWRDLRRNLVSHMLNPPRVKQLTDVRHRAIDRLVDKLRREAEASDGVVQVPVNCRFSVFCILLVMCFGEEFDESTIEKMDNTHKEVLMALSPRLDDYLPPIFGPLFAKQKNIVKDVRRRQMEFMVPFIDKRRKQLESKERVRESYLDSLFELRLEDENRRKLSNGELVSLCSEFLNGGTDTTAAGLEWAVAHLVHDQKLQEDLYAEIVEVTGNNAKLIDEEDIEKMTLLGAVVKETLRMHPPTHFLLSHAASEYPASLGGYDIPPGATVEFYTAGIGMDPKLWNDPTVFRPRRFMEEAIDVDVKGVKNLKMMPFGAGRRICAGLNVGNLHLSLILARIIQAFKWLPVPGEDGVDFSEQFAFTVVMKKPLRALIQFRDC